MSPKSPADANSHPTVDEPAPKFSLPAHDGETIKLEQFRGKPVVLYFYPKDDTSGCTAQACDLRDDFPAFNKAKAVILGVSPDSVKSHEKFRAKYNLPFTLLADTDHAVAERYGVWREKKLYGRTYMGIVRTTFVIDSKGILRHVLPVKKVAEHAEQVLTLLQELS